MSNKLFKIFGIIGLILMFIGGLIGLSVPFIIIIYINGKIPLYISKFVILILGFLLSSFIVGGLGYLILRIIESKFPSD